MTLTAHILALAIGMVLLVIGFCLGVIWMVYRFEKADSDAEDRALRNVHNYNRHFIKKHDHFRYN